MCKAPCGPGPYAKVPVVERCKGVRPCKALLLPTKRIGNRPGRGLAGAYGPYIHPVAGQGQRAAASSPPTPAVWYAAKRPTHESALPGARYA